MARMPAQKPGRSKQDYGTPAAFLHAVRAYLGIEDFDADLAASRVNAVTAVYFTQEQNSLLMDWKVDEGWNWLNPPFGRIGPWVEKAWNEALSDDAHTAVLIPASTGANWWRDYVHRKAQVLLLNGRITFVGCDDPYPKDCALLLYHGNEIRRRMDYDVWQWTKEVA